MPQETMLQLAQKASLENLANIERRIKENSPIELRTIPRTNITLRVVGYIFGNPVYHPDDDRAFWEWVDSCYKCHICCDSRRVYLHGEHRLPPEERAKERGDPCPNCVPKVTRQTWWNDVEKLPESTRTFLRGMLSAYMQHVIPPHGSKNQALQLCRDLRGDVISLDGEALTIQFAPYSDPKNDDLGRIYFTDDQGRQHDPKKKKRREE